MHNLQSYVHAKRLLEYLLSLDSALITYPKEQKAFNTRYKIVFNSMYDLTVEYMSC